MIIDFIINIAYLIGALAFVWGLRLLSSPDTARRGNIVAGVGMVIAIIAAIGQPIEGASNNYLWIIGAIVIGAIVGLVSAKKVQMTAMPQMVSIFNGLGGACAVVLAYAELVPYYSGIKELDMAGLIIILLALLIGGISFTGSMLAFAKLQGLVWDSTITLPRHDIVNMVLLLITLGMGGYLVASGVEGGLLMGSVFMVLALIYGFSFVAPIGGADMPVVISLLNSFTGLSAAVTGLIYGSQFMLVGGILVGASGTILTVLMCEAMNRSLMNVLIGGFGGGGASAKGADGEQVAKEVTLNDAAIQLFYSQSAIIVPGYGLAVAQAQKVCKEVDELLEKNGVEVRYAIHPVAGRMPGHMNVLLAEADVPYPKLLDLEEANDALKNTDMVVIVGANDVVNPAAEDDPGSPIYGMPVLKVWEAKNVIVLKRSMRPGYAGIENPLFFHEKTRMLFGDAKDTLSNLASEIKSL
ncbi:NAD(P)(+) transhydrogenase (Re/Si-specific) subunit beta [Phaeodactylibacter sp.]|jgi:NAD(P) transhydrogenase subunit beta|uniref:NAD(P)(+) transhydrogenase (Re/Si-specific) subunit beta n=1 Tax=Phaeodactylibacter sp. TaxID=1940289 RepID=UPI0025FE0243|nr:NAD(P)(+) transhydrogenase (Re/Si-specific) subunit beta [Phaeodactylibacter sp.]MCI4651392.1 NAD(P)(+) transhydrogenase (Re/Si-specific) subunit beta [Phaeodactylibacter sp.]MCI5094399.1 NAD(P)(+) transhydrogenase (Re/Si-specific) subunit beta [Phaeodactylibacter sp.]